MKVYVPISENYDFSFPLTVCDNHDDAGEYGQMYKEMNEEYEDFDLDIHEVEYMPESSMPKFRKEYEEYKKKKKEYGIEV